MYPPPRPMQMSMGMLAGGGRQNIQMTQQVQQVEQKRPDPIHLQVKPRSITFTPGATPIAVKTPSATVIVANSKERLKGDKSQHRSVVIEQLDPPQGGSMNMQSMQMGMGGPMGYMMGQYPAYPGCQRPPGMMPMGGTTQTMAFRTPSGTLVMSQSMERLQQKKAPMEPISLQVGRGSIRVTPGGKAPIAVKTPSTTVIVNNSQERLRRGSVSGTMSPTAFQEQRRQSQSGLAVLASLLDGGANVHVATGSTGGMEPVRARRTPSATVIMSASSECLYPPQSRSRSSQQDRRSLSRSEVSASFTVPVQVAPPKRKVPIIMAQPPQPPAPQMQEVVLTGMTDYTATVVLILTPEDERGQ